jgi:hypothetical protein
MPVPPTCPASPARPICTMRHRQIELGSRTVPLIVHGRHCTWHHILTMRTDQCCFMAGTTNRNSNNIGSRDYARSHAHQRTCPPLVMTTSPLGSSVASPMTREMPRSSMLQDEKRYDHGAEASGQRQKWQGERDCYALRKASRNAQQHVIFSATTTPRNAGKIQFGARDQTLPKKNKQHAPNPLWRLQEMVMRRTVLPAVMDSLCMAPTTAPPKIMRSTCSHGSSMKVRCIATKAKLGDRKHLICTCTLLL